MFTYYDKALAGLITPIIVGIFSNIGIPGTMTLEDMVNYCVVGLLTFVSVYFASNKVK
jgi:hypothetical protein